MAGRQLIAASEVSSGRSPAEMISAGRTTNKIRQPDRVLLCQEIMEWVDLIRYAIAISALGP